MNKLSIMLLRKCIAHNKLGLEHWPYKVRQLVSQSVYANNNRMALPVPTKAFYS